ncbi:inward rectifier potassium channel [Nitzschia inconspicua]|uniref:Inward rectifier potassium channel n=1 Tax=Nitzschia inconspicua TaxID=303405 RepID=A0A9K3PKL5_9STRA|nr:inward rectifier potassium channel [Nitzschia inconspicua]
MVTIPCTLLNGTRNKAKQAYHQHYVGENVGAKGKGKVHEEPSSPLAELIPRRSDKLNGTSSFKVDHLGHFSGNDASAPGTERRPTCIRMDEGSLFPPTIFSRVALQNDTHPFFKRVWTLRHKLDKNSPLLDRKAISIIENFHADGGIGFPPELNHHEQLRKHVKFQEISVTMSGTDHLTGNDVYGSTSYTSKDLVVGYRFANALIRDSKTKEIGMNLSLLNVVLEQHGGGGEPLFGEPKFSPPLTMVDIADEMENQMYSLDVPDLPLSRL